MERWISAGMLLVVSMVVWLITRADIASAGIYKNLIFSLIITDILIAGISVYDQRGMASRAVALFFIPIVLSAVFRSAKALFATAALAAAVYAYAAIRYFFDNPSEGYKIELYGEVGFYSATFFIAAALLRLLIAESKKNIKPKT
jgi:K+-sensing histidine kinase KdpD